jgi:endonuclease III
VRARAAALDDALMRLLPEARCELTHRNAFELLIAVILSAQTTDKGVNLCTPGLFARFPTPVDLAAAELTEVEALVKRTGFYRMKAKHIVETARLLVERHGGEVPRTEAELRALPGVARKTANVVLGTAFQIANGIAVDTHAARVSKRLKLTAQTDPVKIEQDLLVLFPQSRWIDMHHRLVLFGRYTCQARAPRCGECPCAVFCPSRVG